MMVTSAEAPSASSSSCQLYRFLHGHSVWDVVKSREDGRQRALIELPATASVQEALSLMHRCRLISLPIWSPPGVWVGAGGSLVVARDPSTHEPQKQYIGIVNVLDILALVFDRGISSVPAGPSSTSTTGSRCEKGPEGEGLVASGSSRGPLEKEGREEGEGASSGEVGGGFRGEEGSRQGEEKVEGRTGGLWDLQRMPVSSLVGRSFEGLTLWTAMPHSSLSSLLEILSKGVHRVLVPLPADESDQVRALFRHVSIEPSYKLTKESDAESFAMITQTDVARFVLLSGDSNVDDDKLGPFLSQSVEAAGAVQECVVAVGRRMNVLKAAMCLRQAGLTAAPVVEESPEGIDDDPTVLLGHGQHVIGSVSASDFRGCTEDSLEKLSNITVEQFLCMSQEEEGLFFSVPAEKTSMQAPITCHREEAVRVVLERMVEARIHRCWLTKRGTNALEGVVALSDVLGALWRAGRTQGKM